MINQRIVCAANKFVIKYSENEQEILIIAGVRHWDAIMRGVWDTLDDYIISCIDRNKEEQGFLDQFNNFLTRKEAYIIAKEKGQIIRDLGYETNELFSEHLY